MLQYFSPAGGTKLEGNGSRLRGCEGSVVGQVHLCVGYRLGSRAIVLLVDHIYEGFCRDRLGDSFASPGN